MASHVDPNEVEVYPDEVKSFEGSVPLFLKIVYVGFTAFGIFYWFTYKNGELGNALVQTFNTITGVGQ